MIELVHCPGPPRLLTEPIRLTEDRDLVGRRGLDGRGTCRARSFVVAEDGHAGAFGDGAHLLEDCHLLRVDDLYARRSQHADARSRRNLGVLVERNRGRLKGRRSGHHAHSPLRQIGEAGRARRRPIRASARVRKRCRVEQAQLLDQSFRSPVDRMIVRLAHEAHAEILDVVRNLGRPGHQDSATAWRNALGSKVEERSLVVGGDEVGAADDLKSTIHRGIDLLSNGAPVEEVAKRHQRKAIFHRRWNRRWEEL
jgi:hypothetical protein